MRGVIPPSKQWEIKYQTHEENFLFIFRDDGTGTCCDVDYGVTVSFSWDPNNLPKEEGPDHNAFLEELAEDLFWSEINDQLGEDAVIGDSEWSEDFGACDVEFMCGSRQELERLTRLILYSFPGIWADGEEQRTITFSAEGENSGESAGLGEDADNLDLGGEIAAAERSCLVELLTFAIRQNTPVGEELEYNDGPSNRRSGYSWYAKSVDVEVTNPSFHEMAEARGQLRHHLEAFLSSADLERLLPLD